MGIALETRGQSFILHSTILSDSPSEGPVAASAEGEEVGEGGPVAGAHDVDVVHVRLRDLSPDLGDQLQDELGVRRLAGLPEHIPAAFAAIVAVAVSSNKDDLISDVLPALGALPTEPVEVDDDGELAGGGGRVGQVGGGGPVVAGRLLVPGLGHCQDLLSEVSRVGGVAATVATAIIGTAAAYRRTLSHTLQPNLKQII